MMTMVRIVMCIMMKVVVMAVIMMLCNASIAAAYKKQGYACNTYYAGTFHTIAPQRDMILRHWCVSAIHKSKTRLLM